MRPGVGVPPPALGPRWDVEPCGFGQVLALVVMVLALGLLAMVSEVT